MRILVTGAASFLGAHTAALLLDAGHMLRLLAPSRAACAGALALHGFDPTDLERTDTVHFIDGDITDREAVHKAIVGCDAVVHVAAHAAPHASRRKPAAGIGDYIVGGTKIVADAAQLSNAPVVVTAPVTTLGPFDRPTIGPDDEPGEPADDRHRSYIAADRELRERQADGQPVSIVYTSTLLGPVDPAVSSGVQSLRSWLQHGIPTTVGTKAAHVDVRDAAAVVAAALDRDGEPRRFLAFGHLLDMSAIADTIDALTGHRIRRAPVPPMVLDAAGAVGAVRRYFGSPTAHDRSDTAALFSWKPADQTRTYGILGQAPRPFRATIADTLRWLSEEGALPTDRIGLL